MRRALAPAMLGYVRCLIVDDNARFLEAAGALLAREGVEVVGSASTRADALQRTQELKPDVVLVDISLRGESGFDVARDLQATGNHAARVILISTHPEEDFADLIETSPAEGFLPKSRLSAAAIRDLLDAG